MRITKNIIDTIYTLCRSKRIYNSKKNKIIKPYKVECIKSIGDNQEEKIFVGHIGAIKFKKVTRPYVNMDKLRNNQKDYFKYVSETTSWRLTDEEIDAVELKEVA